MSMFGAYESIISGAAELSLQEITMVEMGGSALWLGRGQQRKKNSRELNDLG